MSQRLLLLALTLLPLLAGCGSAPAPEVRSVAPLRLHPDNPHYFEYERRPTVLITSGEHYGALLNTDFDYVAYLAELESRGLNHTRIFAGTYREVSGDFRISSNTLAPTPEAFICPWPRSDTPGAADGLAKFDLSKWNGTYFDRLKDLLSEAERRGVIVELTLFCPYYRDTMWEVSPLNAANNVNGVGQVDRVDALTLKSAPLVEAQKSFARKIVTELAEVPNLYFEICNEPYARDLTPDDWQREMAREVANADKAAPAPHLISQNYANGSRRVEDPNPVVSLFNFHYSRPPDSVGVNYDLGVAIGNNETGFDGRADAAYRIQGWDFLFAGGALYNNLDYSFAVGHEGGDLDYSETTPGGGSSTLRTQLGFLNRFFHELPFVRMAPDGDVVAAGPEEGSARALSNPGEIYAVYLHHGRVDPEATPRYVVDSELSQRTLTLNLPAGNYSVTWRDPQNRVSWAESQLTHSGGQVEVETPRYKEDIVGVWRAQ